MVLVQIARIDREAKFIEVQLPILPKQRIAIYKEWLWSCCPQDGDKLYLLPTKAKIIEISLICSQYGYNIMEAAPKLMEMGTPEDILRYISNQWGGKSRTEKLRIRSEWRSFWEQHFPQYAIDCYMMVGSIPSTGYSMNISSSTYVPPVIEPEPVVEPIVEPVVEPVVEPTPPAELRDPIILQKLGIPEIPVAIAIGLAGLAFAMLSK